MEIYEDIKPQIISEIEKEKFSKIFEQAPVGYYILDKKGTIIEMNDKGASLIKANQEDKQNFKKFISHSTLVTFNDFLEEVFSSYDAKKCIVHNIYQDDPKINLEITGSCFQNNQACLLSISEIEDIETLKISEIRFRKLFESSKDGILVFNAESGKILDVNQVLISILGLSYDQIMGKNIEDICAFKEIISKDKQLNDPILFAFSHDGRTIDVEIVSNSYQYDTTTEIQCNFRDITERKRHEKELEENKRRLEELNHTKDKFFSIISHDLRSPFNCIIGYSELMMAKVQSHDCGGIEEYADKIQKSSWSAMNLLSNLIEWSRSQSGKIEFKPEHFTILSIIDEVFKYTLDAAEQKSISIVNTVSNDIRVYADKSMLSIILRNLISNSIKFTYPKGTIIINALNKPEETVISVCDNGVGMDENVKKKLFKLDECYSNTGTNEEKGTGLGLMLCKEFVTKHNGNIWVESEPGQGSCFFVSFPKEF